MIVRDGGYDGLAVLGCWPRLMAVETLLPLKKTIQIVAVLHFLMLNMQDMVDND